MPYTSYLVKHRGKLRRRDPETRAQLAFRFRAMYRNLGLDLEGCAKLLHVTERTLHNWQSGKHDIPYSAYRLLRLLNRMELPGASLAVMVMATEWRSIERSDAARGCASMGLLGVPSEIEHVVVWLASDAASVDYFCFNSGLSNRRMRHRSFSSHFSGEISCLHRSWQIGKLTCAALLVSRMSASQWCTHTTPSQFALEPNATSGFTMPCMERFRNATENW